MNGPSIKVSMIGDGNVGKTCLWSVYVKNVFPSEYAFFKVEESSSTVELNGILFNLNIWVTARQKDNQQKLRPLLYANTDAIVLCYAIDNRTSFDNLTSRWIPELSQHCSKIPVVLVGTKLDKRKVEKGDNFLNNSDQISYSEGKKKKKEIGATSFVECSALDGTNVQVVFEEALQSALRLHDKKRCSIL